MIISRKARQLTRGHDCLSTEAEDFEQELAVQQWVAAKRFDPGLGSAASFARCVAANKAGSIADKRKAKRRTPRTTPPRSSGNASAHDEGECDVVDISDLREAERQRQQDLHISLDVARHVDGLSPRHRDLCDRLKHSTVTDAAKASGRSRDAVYDDIAELRRHFERAGLHAYLGSDSFAASPVPTSRRQA